MIRRRNSDARLRELTRRIAAGEHDLIPLLAREWARTGGAERPSLDGPLSIQQIRDRALAAGFVSGVVSVYLHEVIDGNDESFLNVLSTRLTGYESLMDILYKIVGLGENQDELLIEVTGDPSLILDHFEHTIDPDTAHCGRCNSDLTRDESVVMIVQPGNGRVFTRLDAFGDLVDVERVIASGHLAGATCARCGESFDT